MAESDRILLNGRKIVVTRPTSQADGLCRLIENAGGIAIRLPVIEIVPPDNPSAPCRLLSSINHFNLVIFISRNAVIHALRLSPDLLSRIAAADVYAVGAGSARQIRDMSAGNTAVAIADTGSGSEALLELDALQAVNITGKRALIIRGNKGRELLAEALAERGAEVTYVEVYRRTRPAVAPGLIKKIWQVERPDAIVITSAEGLQNLIHMTDPADQSILFNTPLVVLSARLQALAQSLGFSTTPEIATDAGDAGLMQALMRTFEA